MQERKEVEKEGSVRRRKEKEEVRKGRGRRREEKDEANGIVRRR